MKSRYRVIFFIIAFFCLAAVARLIDLQIVHGEYYRELSDNKLLRTSVVKAPRGEILDRQGRTVVTNKTAFSVQIHYISGQSDRARNDTILKLIKLAQKDETYIEDIFPITEAPFEYTLEKNELTEWKQNHKIEKDATAEQAIKTFMDKYGVTGEVNDNARGIVAVRYGMEMTNFSSNNPYTFADDVSEEMVTKIKEMSRDFPGVAAITAPVRDYPGDTTAAHILGRVGRIYKEEYETLRNEGYSMNDSIGKQGVEKYFEKTLKGTDGTSRVEQSVDTKEIKITENKAPVSGNNIVLTLDLEVQKAAEQALVQTINEVIERSAVEGGKGYDCSSGAIVALDVNTGEVIAMASYPTYSPDKFDSSYKDLISNSNLPLLNRAIGGVYAPGSTFKMITAIAGLEENIITPSDTVYDTGVYTFYEGFSPKCWIYNSSGGGHGAQNVSLAIQNSCNFFFYDLGRRTGIENIVKYAKLFGLGQKTGIEIEEEEATGLVAGPEERKEKGGDKWWPGDTLNAAIGQSDNMFTPLQLANYVATIANGGKRYKPHLVREIRDSVSGEVISYFEPEVMSETELSSSTYKAVLEGMKNVTEGGTASAAFSDFNIQVAGKTGTAEVPSGSDNAVFVGFAPFDKPQLAICVVIEHGVHGSSIATAARTVFDTYFNKTIEPDEILSKNILIR